MAKWIIALLRYKLYIFFSVLFHLFFHKLDWNNPLLALMYILRCSLHSPRDKTTVCLIEVFFMCRYCHIPFVSVCIWSDVVFFFFCSVAHYSRIGLINAIAMKPSCYTVYLNVWERERVLLVNHAVDALLPHSSTTPTSSAHYQLYFALGFLFYFIIIKYRIEEIRSPVFLIFKKTKWK